MPISDKSKKKNKFSSIHGNYKNLRYQQRIHIYNSHEGFTAKRYKETSNNIATVIEDAIIRNKRLRVVGSRWSLSRAPYVKDILVFTRNEDDVEDLKYKTFITNTYLNNPGMDKEFLFAQCGNKIEDINIFADTQKRSLQASGASNGQTIAGAIGTGVHGSGIKVGSIQDSVVGLHIIKGSHPEDSVYLQSKSNPIVNEAFAKRFGAVLVEDDAIFHAALVSLGTFGFVHGVTIQTVPRYKLLNVTRKVDISDAFNFSKTLKLKNSPLDIQKELIDKHGDNAQLKEWRLHEMTQENLYHMKFYINQHDLQDNVRAEIIYKVADTRRRNLTAASLLKYNKDISLVKEKKRKTIGDHLIPAAINIALPKGNKREEGYLNEIFARSKNVRGFEFAMAIGVNTKDAERVFKLLLEYFDEPGGQRVTSTFSLRYVKKSKATLAFTKFNITCIIGLDGIYLSNRKRYDKLVNYMTAKLALSDIPHSWHMGKVNSMDADLVKEIYKTKLSSWKRARTTFLSPEVQKVFSSDYTDKLGLTM